MLIKKFRLQSPDDDNSGTDVAEETQEELESADTGEPEQLEQEPVEAGEQAEIVSLDEPEQNEEGTHKGKNLPNELRRLLRQEQKEKKRLAEELERVKTGGKTEDPGKEPELEDFDYDADQFKAAYRQWTEKQAEYKRKQEQQRAQQEELEKEFQARQNAYIDGKKKYKPELIQEAEAEVTSVLSQQRQGMLLDVADDPAALVAVLGASPKTLREVAAIKSDARFIAELVKIQMKLTTEPKKTAPPPERVVSGGGRTPGQSANKLEQLKEEARKTGDYTAYHREKERQGK
jgi:hypothetical protein